MGTSGLRGACCIPRICPLLSIQCQPVSADSLYSARVITVLSSTDFIFTYRTVFLSIRITSARLLAPHSRHSHASKAVATTPFSVSMVSLERVVSFSCDVFFRYSRRFSRSMNFALRISFIFCLLRPVPSVFSLVPIGLREARCTRAFICFPRCRCCSSNLMLLSLQAFFFFSLHALFILALQALFIFFLRPCVSPSVPLTWRPVSVTPLLPPANRADCTVTTQHSAIATVPDLA